MRLSDWINNIRWKYFTNNKAGLIFKELMKEFQMVDKMIDCNNCKHENECNHNERYDWDLNGIWDYKNESDEYIESYKDISELLNEQEETIQRLKRTMKGVAEILSIEADLFSDKATEHDINAYRELQEFDNKDAYYMAVSIKEAIKMLRGDIDD